MPMAIQKFPVPATVEPTEAANTAVTHTTTQSAVENGEDHSDGAEIRRQVEYYFSDENLPTDEFLLKCCGGRNNDPVSLNRVCSFKKMRQYKPRRLVIAALRKSAFLDVSVDGKTIKRKVPLQGKCMLDPDFLNVGDIAHDPSTGKAPVQRLHEPTDIKRALPSGMTKNMMKPTGFEATHVEGPITPQEAAEEEVMYDPDRMFVERIEIAIQRFKQKRRMHSMYARVFDKLMVFGGVDQGQRVYQGLSKQELAEMDAEEIARALATHHVPWDRSNRKFWKVDFEGIAKAFLSSWYPKEHGFDPAIIKNACQVPRSFYNYLLYHSVCPEFSEQLKAALDICDQAEKELGQVNAALQSLPGAYNKSGSVMFGGAYADMYVGNQAWATEAKGEGIQIQDNGLREEEARIIFYTGVAVMASHEQYNRLKANRLKVVKQEAVTLRIVSIELPTGEAIALFDSQNETTKHKIKQLEPLGKLKCSAEVLQEYEEWDLPASKYPNGKLGVNGSRKEYIFWVEEGVLQNCFIGMMINAEVLVLQGGMCILDEVTETMCSFYTLLPNELWAEHKPKEIRWLERRVESEAEIDENESDE